MELSEFNRIYCEDSLNFMKNLPAQWIDKIVSSPPSGKNPGWCIHNPSLSIPRGSFCNIFRKVDRTDYIKIAEKRIQKVLQ